ncbi:MAG: sigma-54 dependent transcriptional regulator, partial [Verrucomicrobiae bacterium]|nr:sigma-54 dependent transcriptional regulator [Verrucomicrobiae bacterium]
MSTKPTLLIVDDERNTREGLEQALRDRYHILLAEDAASALDILQSQHVHILLTDLRLPGDDGMTLLKRALALPQPPVCLMMTAYGSVENAVEAMHMGAADYVTKPINLDDLEVRLERALQTARLKTENVALRAELDQKFGLENIIGQSPAMLQIFDTVQQVAPSRATVLITGETGTGKELIAHAIHNLSPRKNGPFIVVHAAALPATLLESELFGHERGAFTGAVERRLGRFELADGGTLFLDEIGELEPAIQVKLLRVLEEQTFERVGSSKPIKIDVRLVAATNRNLLDLVKAGKFREDLYYRLSVVTLHLPPLRERREDIPLLITKFLADFSRENNKQVREITLDAVNILKAYDWPGNVRELRNVIEQMVVLARSDRLTLRDVPAHIRGSADLTKISVLDNRITVKDAERQLIIQALKAHNGNRTRA